MAEEQDLVIPLVEERVFATKREVETGRVRVSTHTDRHEEMVRVDLARDEVEVTRVPKNEEIAEAPEPREEGDVTIVPVVEERLVVEKKLVLVEEIHIRRTRSSEEFTQPVTLARQRAEVEREEAAVGKNDARSRAGTGEGERDREVEGSGYAPRIDKSGL